MSQSPTVASSWKRLAGRRGVDSLGIGAGLNEPCRRRQRETRRGRRAAGEFAAARPVLRASVLRRRREAGLIDVLESRNPFRFSNPQASKVVAFEKQYAAHVGTKFALGVTSGTAALYTAVAALEVGPGDEVILPAWNWYACYDAIVLSGALPVFAEIDESFNIDPKDIVGKITPRTKVIMAVPPPGVPGRHGPDPPDCAANTSSGHRGRAQCVGGSYKGKHVGSIGDIGIYSFQLSKTITAGEGGAVVTAIQAL